MNILFVSSELAPYSKVGGLADVAGSLPQALESFVDSMLVITPLYGQIDRKKYRIEPFPLQGSVRLGENTYPYSIYQAKGSLNHKTQNWFVRSEQFFDRDGIYTDESGSGFKDNNLRYLFFQMVVLDLLQQNLIPMDILHCNDHHTGLLPALLKSNGIKKKCIFTIHNFLYQGHFSVSELKLLPGSLADLLTKTQWNNYSALLEGMTHADIATTVSKGYAEELLAGEHIDAHSHQRLLGLKQGLQGIVNGIDTEYWDPETDIHIPHHYSVSDLTGKIENKRVLLERMGLAIDIKAPLIGSISRLVENKGFPLVVKLLEEFTTQGVRFVFLGSGDPKIAEQLTTLRDRFPQHIALENGFNEPLAHLIEAGSDMFLMPSRFEPCGLNQLYSLRYGTVPIVHNTGGLKDTVEPWSPGRGTGFMFEPYDEEQLRQSMKLAIKIYAMSSEWTALVARGMAKDFSWDWSAAQYYQLYESRE